MSELESYKRAYQRERVARLEAERLLDEKTRALYNNVVALESTVKKLKKTRAQLVQSEKMATIGQLAAGVAHEINNPVGFVLGNTQVLEGYVKDLLALDKQVMNEWLPRCDEALVKAITSWREALDLDFVHEDAPDLMADSLSGLTRVKDIVHNLKTVTHSGNGSYVDSDINDCVEQSLKVVMNEIKYKVEVKTDFAEIPSVPAQFAELQQVFINLFVNAAHACTEDGLLSITTSTAQVNEADWVLIQVKDNGVGMPESVQRKIFDPFYTTKEVGVGTGLGLSVSFGIVERHQGWIEVDSREGEGSTFSVFLPLHRKARVETLAEDY